MKYLIAIDFSDSATKAVDFALKLAKKGEDEIILLCIAELYERNLINTLQVDFDYQILDSANQDIMLDMKETLKKTQEKYRLQGHKVTTQFDSGKPKDKIIEYAESLKADMLVVGSRGISPVKVMLLGSVSDHCTKYAHCPVLVVH